MATPLKAKGVLFDFGSTLMKSQGFDLEAGCRKLLELSDTDRSIDPDIFIAKVTELDENIWQRMNGSPFEFPIEALFRIVADSFGLRYKLPLRDLQIEIWKVVYSYEPAPGIAGALDALARAGLPCAVLSNCRYAGGVLEWELERCALLGHFRFVMSTADYGFRKPYPEIFSIAVERLGLEPGDIWYLGDSLDRDVHGALKAGMAGVWYNPDNLPVEPPAPSAILSGWDELEVTLQISSRAVAEFVRPAAGKRNNV